MDDLIKRQDAITAYCEHECGIKGMTRENCGCDDCGTIFDDIPPARPERKKGKWIKKKGSLWTLATCSVCGELSVEGDKPFCPNCGAEMGGKS